MRTRLPQNVLMALRAPHPQRPLFRIGTEFVTRHLRDSRATLVVRSTYRGQTDNSHQETLHSIAGL